MTESCSECLAQDIFQIDTALTTSVLTPPRGKMSRILDLRDWAPYGSNAGYSFWADALQNALDESVRRRASYGESSVECGDPIIMPPFPIKLTHKINIPRAAILRGIGTHRSSINIKEGEWTESAGVAVFNVPGAFWVRDLQINCPGLPATAGPLFSCATSDAALRLDRVAIGDMLVPAVKLQGGNLESHNSTFGTGAYTTPTTNLALIEVYSDTKARFHGQTSFIAVNGRGTTCIGLRIYDSRDVLVAGDAYFSGLDRGIEIVPRINENCHVIRFSGSITGSDLRRELLYVAPASGGKIQGIYGNNAYVSSTLGHALTIEGAGELGEFIFSQFITQSCGAGGIVIKKDRVTLRDVSISGCVGDGIAIGGSGDISGIFISGRVGGRGTLSSPNTGYGFRVGSGNYTRLKIDIDATGNTTGAHLLGGSMSESDITIFDGVTS